jgi:alkylation response protein AidB-like acyl-CoA dehydrogenase
MAQPNDFGFGEEATLLKESARKFFSENFPTDKLHAMVADNPDPERMSGAAWDQALWQQMVDLGWTCLAVPESAGGLGMPLAAVAGLVEELGRAAFPCPLMATLNATYVLAACGSSAEPALAEIAEGRAATIAITGSDGGWALDGSEVSCSEGKLSGTAWFVQDARKSESVLVAAKSGDALGLYWVGLDAEGVTVSPDAIVDLTRDQAHITFDNAAALQVSSDAVAALSKAMPAVYTVLAADVVGAAEWQLQTSIDYVSTRQQFDHPLGFFQAVKHPLVDVMVQIDEAKSLVYNAACAFDTEPERAEQFAHMAKASASETAAFASGRSVQSHGGIGFTWECFVHLYFKRQKHSQLLWGDAAWHRACLADLLMGEVA